MKVRESLLVSMEIDLVYRPFRRGVVLQRVRWGIVEYVMFCVCGVELVDLLCRCMEC